MPRYRRCVWCLQEQDSLCFNGQARICIRCAGEEKKRRSTTIGLVPKTRVCRGCERDLPIAEFQSSDRNAGGKRRTCRWCVKVKAWRTKGVIGDIPARPPTHCEICGAPDIKLNMDHCHETGQFRGFLCNNCNLGIGLLGDTAESVGKAVRYLERVHDGSGPDVAADLHVS